MFLQPNVHRWGGGGGGDAHDNENMAFTFYFKNDVRHFHLMERVEYKLMIFPYVINLEYLKL